MSTGLPSLYAEDATRRQYMFELQEKLKTFSDEVRKKDELIRQLMSVDPRPGTARFGPGTSGTVFIDPGVAPSSNGVALSNVSGKIDLTLTPSQLAPFAQPGLTTRLPTYDVTTLQVELREKMEIIAQLRREIEIYKEENYKQAEIVKALRKQMEEGEKRLGNFDLLKGRSDVAITELQKQNRLAQERVLELETRVRTLVEEKERTEQGKSMSEKRLIELNTQLVRVLGFEASGPSEQAFDRVLVKVSEVIQENAMLKGKVVSMQAQMSELEKEHLQHRDTVQQLMRQIQGAPDLTEERRQLRETIEKLEFEKKQLQRETELLKGRVETLDKQLAHAQKHVEERDARLSKFDVEKRESGYQARNAETQLTALRQSLASMLSDAFTSVAPTEDGIKARIQELLNVNKDKLQTSKDSEEKLKTLSKQFQSQYEAHHEAERRSRLSEQQVAAALERVRALEQELAAGDVIRDGLRADKDKYLRLMEKLLGALKLDAHVLDLGTDMIVDAVFGRVEQLTRGEAGQVAEKSTLVYQLQRKLQRLKEQLESKDLHLELMRKKLAQLDERARGRAEFDGALAEETAGQFVRSAEQRVEKLQRQLDEARAENNALKAELLECSNLRIQAIEQDKEVQALERTLEKLERVRQKQARRIAELRGAVEERERQVGGHRSAAETTVSSLSNELRQLKLSLEDTRRREKQLLELRAVVARLLGLDVSALPVPDVEILNRIERLVRTHDENSLATFTADRDLEHVSREFRAGAPHCYDEAGRLLGRRRASLSSGASSAQPHHHHKRSRSPSPVHRSPTRLEAEVDPRRY